MDNKKQQHQENGHGSGFLLGVIVGVLLTLLFTTKRGREILHDVTEKGMKKVSELEKIKEDINVKEFYEKAEEDESDDYQKSEQTEDIKILAREEKQEEKPATKPKETPKKEEAVKVEKKSPEKSITGRRWFRGSIKKKS